MAKSQKKTATPATGGYELVLVNDLPLGAGTRKRGTVVAYADHADQPIDEMRPADDVSELEWRSLVLNADFVELRPVNQTAVGIEVDAEPAAK